MDGSSEIDRKSIKSKFKERYNVAKKIKKNRDRDLIKILDFIDNTLKKL
jgi:hypothetical protein